MPGPVTIDSPSPLDADTLSFRSMTAVEALSQCFEYAIMVSSTADLKATDLLGVATTVHLETTDGGIRHYSGVIASLEYLGPAETINYRLVLRPWLWLLTASSNCRIFQNQTVVDIILSVFNDLGFSDVDSSGLTTGNYKPREYVVQYRETDFDFVSRLMEREGIYYYFSHEADKHTLVLVDTWSVHEAPATANGSLQVPFLAGASHEPGLVETIDNWRVQNGVESGAYSHVDFDFTKSRAKLQATRKNPLGYANDALELYDYPGGFDDNDVGGDIAQVRLLEYQLPFQEAAAWSDHRKLTVGYLFSLVDHPRDDQNRDYLVTSMTSRLRGHDLESGAAGGEGEIFECGITAIESSRQFRPRASVRKPIVRGPQTAIVVGPGGAEIWADKYGRVKVQFHWDREGGNNEKSSCFVRVTQAWAGSQFGAIFIPRIGQEVIVDFLEGDPDRPIITGCVYNDVNMPPYDLPANQTQSGVKTRSSKGGNLTNANEVRFEDLKGSEELFVQAEKDLNSVVKHNETRKVGVNRTVQIGADEALTVGNNRTVSVVKNETIAIGGNETVNVDGNQSVTIGINDSLSVGGSQSLSVSGSRNQEVLVAESIVVGGVQSVTAGSQVVSVGSRTKSVGANESASIGGGYSQDVGGAVSITIGGARTESVGADETVNITGGQTVTIGKKGAINVTQQLIIDAGDELVIKAGDASITLKKNGDIVLKGKNLTSDASGKVSLKAGSDLVLKGSKISQN